MSQLKAKIGQYMRAVRAGREVVITDRGQPVARLVPYDRSGPADRVTIVLRRDPAAPALGDVRVRGVEYDGPSTLELLQEDRRR